MKTNIKTNRNFNFKALMLIAGLALVLSAGFTSCNDEKFLEEKSLSILVTDNAYSSVVGIRQGIAGLHEHVRRRWYFGEEHQGHGGTWKCGLGTDVAFHGEDPGAVGFFNNYETYMLPSGSHDNLPQFFWEHGYALIQRANYVIEACEALDPTLWQNAGQKAAFIAEAKFFRAWAHRNLVSFYGEVPVVDWVTRVPKLDFVRDPVEKAYTLMEADLKEATTNLPRRTEEEGDGRITQGAAWHLLCEVYLAQHKYTEAVDAASKIIDGDQGYALMTVRFGGKNSVWGTGDVFWDLHASDNHNLDNNTEAIWVMQIEPVSAIDGRSNQRWGRAYGPAYFRLPDANPTKKQVDGKWVVSYDVPFNFQNGTTSNLYTDTLGRGVAWIHPTNHTAYTIWKDNWNNDYRNAKHMILRDFYYYNPDVPAIHGKKIDFNTYDYETRFTREDGTIDETAMAARKRNDTCQYIFPFFLKGFDPCNVQTNVVTAGNGDSFKDFYLMRVAETYLLRAEAYIGLGQLDNAVADINKVRTRSNAKPINVGDAEFATSPIDYLLDERIRELYGEENRHIVLRRVDYGAGKNALLERVRTYNNNPVRKSLLISERNVLWPIPLSQIQLNLDVKWENNPGYPGGPAL